MFRYLYGFFGSEELSQSENRERNFGDLSAAIKTHNKNRIAKLISEDNSDSSLFLGLDENNNNVLHLAAQYCVEEDAATLVMIIAYLTKIKSLHLACATNAAGQTPLHLITQFNTLVAMGKMINMVGKKANVAARTYDNQNRLPIMNMFERQKFIDPVMIKPILETTYYNPFELSLTAKIDFKNVVKKNNSYSAKLNANLKLACDVVNQVRDVITESASHPDANHVKCEKLTEMANIINNEIRKYKFDSSEFIEAIKKYKTGNCAEFAALGLHIMRSNALNIGAEYFHLVEAKKCDPTYSHVFIVIDRLPDSDPADSTTWGPNAVICDPWAGKVYPACDFATNMCCHFSLMLMDQQDPTFSLSNIIGLYNPAVHKIGLDEIPCNITPVLKQVTVMVVSLGLFALSMKSLFAASQQAASGSLAEQLTPYTLRTNLP